MGESDEFRYSGAAGTHPDASGAPVVPEPAWPHPATGASPGPVPLPLPLPPGARAGGGGPRRTAVWVIVGAVFAALMLCVAAGFAFNSFFDDYLDMPLDAGVRSVAWSGDGRYAIIEYRGVGADSTASVISWDSETGRTRTADGFRLVATEPSSTQVWVTRAPDETSEEGWASDEEGEWTYESPWDYPSYGGPLSDGPGTAWSWDVAGDAAPEVRTSPEWMPWKGPAGTVARLSVWQSAGLWPMSLEFESPDGDIVYPDTPEEMNTFLPIGWSPSGRYFAIRDGSGEPVAFIIDAWTGKVTAEFEDPGTSSAYGLSDLSGGAAWDPVEDVVWFAVTVWPDDATSSTELSFERLSVDGTQTTFDGAPSEWSKLNGEPALLGTDGSSLLVSAWDEGGLGIWRMNASGTTPVSVPDALSQAELVPGCFSARAGYLATAWNGENLLAGDSAPEVTLFGLDGTLKQIWPPDTGE